MKKLWLLLIVMVLLPGCGQTTYEGREAPCGSQSVEAVPGVISICATDDMSMPVMSTQEGNRFYIADHYEVSLQTMAGGDIDETLKSCTGFDRSRLMVIQTQKDGLARYDCAWTSVGEEGQHVGRTTILDDGNFHYVLTITGQEGEELAAAWKQLSDSFTISIVQ